MEYKSNEMIFTEKELHNIANALVTLMQYDEENEEGLGSGFKDVFNLLNRFNEQLDDIEAMKAEKYRKEHNII